jgi:hypothetical protein
MIKFHNFYKPPPQKKERKKPQGTSSHGSRPERQDWGWGLGVCLHRGWVQVLVLLKPSHNTHNDAFVTGWVPAETSREFSQNRGPFLVVKQNVSFSIC